MGNGSLGHEVRLGPKSARKEGLDHIEIIIKLWVFTSSMLFDNEVSQFQFYTGESI